jgi:uncharacterized protein (TIGR02452 family)
MKIADFKRDFACEVNLTFTNNPGQAQSLEKTLTKTFEDTRLKYNQTYLDSRDAISILHAYTHSLNNCVKNGNKKEKITPWLDDNIAFQALEIMKKHIKIAITESLTNTKSLDDTKRNHYQSLRYAEMESALIQIEIESVAIESKNDRAYNIGLFKQTLKLCDEPTLNNQITKMKKSVFVSKNSNDPQLRVTDKLPRSFATVVTVINQDSFAAARTLINEGKNTPLILDMANKYLVGGGVEHGSNAQEEDLCRCSTLYKGLEQFGQRVTNGRAAGLKKFINPIDEFGSIYVPGVTVIRDSSTKEKLEEKDYFDVDVIAIAGYDLGQTNLTTLEGWLKDIFDTKGKEAGFAAFKNATKDKIRHLFDVAIYRGKDTLVLGALSCGAFKLYNETQGETATLVADAYKEVLLEKKYSSAFNTITFAVLADTKQQNNNFDIFSKALNKLDFSAQSKQATSHTTESVIQQQQSNEYDILSTAPSMLDLPTQSRQATPNTAFVNQQQQNNDFDIPSNYSKKTKAAYNPIAINNLLLLVTEFENRVQLLPPEDANKQFLVNIALGMKNFIKNAPKIKNPTNMQYLNDQIKAARPLIHHRNNGLIRCCAAIANALICMTVLGAIITRVTTGSFGLFDVFKPKRAELLDQMELNCKKI